jgi:hypothetical protein
MLYDTSIIYNQPNYSYSGTLIIYAASLSSPIVLNNVNIHIGSELEDYSNYSTIAVLSIDVLPFGTVTIEVLDQDLSAFVTVQSINILGSNEVYIEN